MSQQARGALHEAERMHRKVLEIEDHLGRSGWAGEQFEVYRCCLAYPIMPTTVVLRSAVPDLCVWVAWASTLARGQPHPIDTGKSTCPCHPVDLVGDAHPTFQSLCVLSDLCG